MLMNPSGTLPSFVQKPCVLANKGTSPHPCLANSRHRACSIPAPPPFNDIVTGRTGWRRSTLRFPACSAARETVPTAALTTPQLVLEYVRKQPNLMEHLHPGKQLEAVELNDGKLNHVFHVYCRDNSSGHLIVKHAPPYAKCLGEALQLSQERLRIEVEAMRMVHSHAPDHVPTIHYYDAEQSVMAMQFLEAPHMKVMLGLHRHGLCYPRLAHHVSSLLSASLFFTSAHVLLPEDMAANAQRFANEAIVAANERVVLTEPLDPVCKSNRQLTPTVQAYADAIRHDAQVLRDLEECVHSYRNKKEALLHNDLHTGNLLATATSTYCIDWEFATVGPMGFDLGCLLGVLLLAYIVLRYQPAPEAHDIPQHPPPGSVDNQQAGRADSSSPRPNSGSSVESVLVEGRTQDGREALQAAVAGHSRGKASGTPHSRGQQCEWLLGALCELWGLLNSKFKRLQEEVDPKQAGGFGSNQNALASANADITGTKSAVLPSPASSQVWADTLGFAAFCMIRLTIGMHAYPGYEFVHDRELRNFAELDSLNVAVQLLALRREALEKDSVCGMQHVVSVVRNKLMCGMR